MIVRLQWNASPENCRCSYSSHWIHLLSLDFHSRRRNRNRIRLVKSSQHQEPSSVCWNLLSRQKSMVLSAFAAFSTTFSPDYRWLWLLLYTAETIRSLLLFRHWSSCISSGTSRSHISLVSKMKLHFRRCRENSSNKQSVKIWALLYGYAQIFGHGDSTVLYTCDESLVSLNVA